MVLYTRVNGAQLRDMKGQSVCLIGKLINQTSETAFELSAPDNTRVEVKLKMPIRDQLDEIIEVYGEVDSRGNINCLNYSSFDHDLIKNFDMDLYSEALTMAAQLPKYYIQQSY